MEKNSESIQHARISVVEKGLLKNTFKDRTDDLLLLTRNALFGFDLTNDEVKTLENTFKTPEVRKLMRKILLPELEKDIPVGQSVDLWMTINAEGADITDLLASREKLVEYIELGLERLANPTLAGVNLTVGKKRDPLTLIARKNFITHTELQLKVIQALVNEKEETEAERVTRMAKDSLK